MIIPGGGFGRVRPADVPAPAHLRHVQHDRAHRDQRIRYDAVLLDVTQDIRKR